MIGGIISDEDRNITPLAVPSRGFRGGELPGTVVLAYALDQMLNRPPPSAVGKLGNIAAQIAIALIAAVAALWRPRARARFTLGLTAPVLIFLLCNATTLMLVPALAAYWLSLWTCSIVADGERSAL